MPKLVRLFIVNALIGFGLAVAFTATLILLDVAGLGRLILGSPDGVIAVIMLVWFSTITFGGVQIAIRVMSMAEDDDGPRGGRRQRVRRDPAPVMLAEPIPAARPAPRR